MRAQPKSHQCLLLARASSVVWAACVLSLALTASTDGANILLITDPASLGNPGDPLAFDQELIDLLDEYGHTVVNEEDREDVTNFASAYRDGPPTEEQLEGIDIVIMSRGANSGEYDDGTEPDDWNSLEMPFILLSPYQTRTSRWGWINSSDVINAGNAPEDFDPFPDPEHPFVAGLSTSVFPPNDVIDYINSMDVPDDATIVATLTIDGNMSPGIVDIPEGTELFQNAQGVISETGGRRVLYQMLDYVDNDDIYRISDNGFEILHQIIETLAPSEEPEPESPRFVRGDFDQDGTILLTDGIGILGWLFQGGADPACMDAADVDDSGSIALNDAIRIFDYLFAGAAPPVAPSPSAGMYPETDCGPDPNEDALDCALSAETCSA